MRDPEIDLRGHNRVCTCQTSTQGDIGESERRVWWVSVWPRMQPASRLKGQRIDRRRMKGEPPGSGVYPAAPYRQLKSWSLVVWVGKTNSVGELSVSSPPRVAQGDVRINLTSQGYAAMDASSRRSRANRVPTGWSRSTYSLNIQDPECLDNYVPKRNSFFCGG